MHGIKQRKIYHFYKILIYNYYLISICTKTIIPNNKNLLNSQSINLKYTIDAIICFL